MGLLIRNTTTLLLAGSLVSGAAAAYFVDEYIDRQVTAYQARMESELQPVKVVVPKADLRVGEALSVANVAVREVPRAFVHRDAVTPGQYDVVEGHKVVFPVHRGEPILLSHLSGPDAEQLSSLIADGKRALTFAADQITSHSGMLAPGDTVDILATLSLDSEPVTVPLLRGIRVLATGSNRDAGHAEPSTAYRTLTLLVTPAEASRLTLARDVGKLAVVLTSRDDKGGAGATMVTKASLLGGTSKKVRRAPGVEIIVGGK